MEQILPLITGSAGALVVLAFIAWGFWSGTLHSDSEFRKVEQERDYWRAASESKDQAIGLERRAVNEAAEAGTVTNQLISAVVAMATEKSGRRRRQLAAEELGP